MSEIIIKKLTLTIEGQTRQDIITQLYLIEDAILNGTDFEYQFRNGVGHHFILEEVAQNGDKGIDTLRQAIQLPISDSTGEIQARRECICEAYNKAILGVNP